MADISITSLACSTERGSTTETLPRRWLGPATRLSERTIIIACLTKAIPPPSKIGSTVFSSAQQFFHRLRSLDLFELREGKLARHGIDRSTGKPICEQKRIDIFVAVDLVLLAVKHRIEKASILTGYSDFIPAIQVAKNEGVMIELWHGEGNCAPHRELWESVDRRVPIKQELIDPVRRQKKQVRVGQGRYSPDTRLRRGQGLGEWSRPPFWQASSNSGQMAWSGSLP